MCLIVKMLSNSAELFKLCEFRGNNNNSFFAPFFEASKKEWNLMVLLPHRRKGI